MSPSNLKKALFTAGALALAATAAVRGQPFSGPGTAQPPVVAAKPASSASSGSSAGAPAPLKPGPVEKFFDQKIPDVLAKGKFDLHVRLRYEQVDEDGVSAIRKTSYAPTLRTRFGYTTAPLDGFQGMLEGVNVTAFGLEHHYNAAGSNGQGDRPPVADPTLTRLDQAWLSYRYTNYFTAKAGEQRIVLDNHRFIGDVGWRQNMQTFDAVALGSEPLPKLDLYYAYLWKVHRVFGNVSGLPAAFTDFNSRSHLIQVAYSGWKYGRFVGYSYLLDLKNAAGAANSAATYGGYFAGAAPVNQPISLDYRAEFAWQTDYAESPLDYGAEYYNLELGASLRPFAFGAGYEDLASGANHGLGGGRASFRTPLATLHSFNGWADVFLTTPGNGLRDLYGYAQWTLPAKIPLRFVYHKFDADYGGGDYGQEFDAVASRKFGKHWTALIKYAYYDGADAAKPALGFANVRVQKFWAQLEFDF